MLIAALGAAVGFLSGLLGIGGGIVMAPLLLYVPSLFGLAPLSMHAVAGLTVVQGLVVCIAGALAHQRHNFVSGPLVGWMGVTIFLAAFIGGAGANLFSQQQLLGVFAAIAFVAAVLIFIPIRQDEDAPDPALLHFSRLRAVIAAGGVGLFGGLVGQGGSFILIPLMTAFLQIPTRIAVGSNLAIVLLSSLAAFLGKAVTGQILWPLVLPLILTAIPAAHFGGLCSRRLPVATLRLVLAFCIAAAAVRIFCMALGS